MTSPTHQPPSRAVLIAAGYLLWVSLFFAIEGAGRRHCQVPSRTWIEAGVDAQDRARRGFTYDKSVACLDNTPWYSYSMAMLFVLALAAPFVVVWLYARRMIHTALDLPFDVMETSAVMYLAVFCIALVLSLSPYGAAHWFYDRVGIGR